MNPQYFCRFFKTHFHTTPISYINQYRVTQAADLLTGSSLSILKLLCIPDLKAPAILPAFSAGLLVCHRKNIEKPCPDPANFFLLNARQHKSQNFDFFKKHLPNSFSYDNILLVAEQKSRQTKQKLRLRGQAVKTSPFHGGNTGSIPVGVIWRRSQVVRQWSATPVSTGSNPVDASSFPETDSFRDFSFFKIISKSFRFCLLRQLFLENIIFNFLFFHIVFIHIRRFSLIRNLVPSVLFPSIATSSPVVRAPITLACADVGFCTYIDR